MSTASPFDMFETDETLEKQGVVVDYGQYWLRVGRLDVPGTPFANYMTEQMRPYTRAIQLGQMDDKVSEEILREGYAKYLTFAWGSKKHGEGKMIGRKGEAIDFTPENVVDLYRQLPQLFQDLLVQSKNFTTFRKAAVEVDAGNSQPS